MSVALVFQLGCSKKKSSPKKENKTAQQKNNASPKPNVQPPAGVQNNFAPAGKNLKILRAALDKEQLLRTQIVSQLPVPMFNGLKSRVVAFKEIDGSVYLIEANKGHSPSVDLEKNQQLILTSFPVVESDEESLTINFNAGMRKVYYAKDWDFYDKSPTFNPVSAYVSESYIEEVKINENDTISIMQRATVNGYPSRGGAGSNQSVRVKYYLSPYAPDPTYAPVEAPVGADEMHQYGFFKISPVVNNEGREVTYAARFHPEKPITFAVSSNTPAEFKEAVKEGILYWNQAFGKKMITAIEAPEGVYAPDVDYNIIQWVDWDAAGFAYADAQMDPRTGQVLNAQVVMTSVFSKSGQAKARRLLKKKKITAQQAQTLQRLPASMLKELDLTPEDLKKALASKGSKQLVLGFPSDFSGDLTLAQHSDKVFNHTHCGRNFAEANLKINAILESGDEARALEIAKDYVREVVAHEVGHNLGLRHNFAGNLAANYSMEERPKIVSQYLEGHLPNVITSSSVMEYQVFEEAAITGRQLIENKTALAYDENVIRKLYMGQDFPKDDHETYTQKSLFCTDDHVGAYADCDRFDLGRSPVENAKYSIKEAVKQLPYNIIRKYISKKLISSEKGETLVNFKETPFNPVAMALETLKPMVPLMVSMDSRGKLIRVHRKYLPTELNESTVQNEQFAYLNEELNKYGGFEQALNHYDLSYGQTAFTEFEEIFKNYTAGVSSTGKQYSFSSSEVETIKAHTQNLYNSLGVYLNIVKLVYLGSADSLRNDTAKTQVATDFRKYLLDQASAFVLAVGPATPEKFTAETKSGDSIEIAAEIPQHYPLSIRTFAANLFRPGRGDGAWGVQERYKLMKQLEGIQKQVLGGVHLDTLRLGSLPESALQWATQYNALREILDDELKAPKKN